MRVPHSSNNRGADRLVRALRKTGVERLFTLSGNQIMPVFDACLDQKMELIHVRHEAAAVHMADAWGRLRGEAGVALLTAGPGHANAIGALYTALMAESPLLMLSGCAPLKAGSGAFQEMAQAAMAGPVCKAAWTVESAEDLDAALARALNTAVSGRPGPVHLSLPFDVLEARGGEGKRVVAPDPQTPELDEASVEAVLSRLEGAERPLILLGPALMREAITGAEGLPLIGMESPRGVNDPSLGDLNALLDQADLLVLLDKKLDFTLRFGAGTQAKIIQIDPDAEVLQRTRDRIAGRLLLSAQASGRALLDKLGGVKIDRGWLDAVQAALCRRPAQWQHLRSPGDGPLHPLDVCRAVQAALERAGRAVFVSDGGEFGQWAQACISVTPRLINGPSGSIGSALPLAIAARCAYPQAAVVALLGDGTFGYHMAEFDTAVRYRLPFVAVIGNDACWNAEYQIQQREYGPQRLIGCELLPARYDRVVEALGGHGEHVTRAAELGPALERAFASGRPACVNVMLQRQPAPTLG